MRLITLGLAAIIASTALAAAQSEGDGRIEWEIERSGSRADAGTVQFTIESRWGRDSRSTWSNSRPIGELQGLSYAQLAGPSGPVRFAIVREAGRLDCGGQAGRQSGSGTCSFTPDAAFGDFLAAQGIGRPTVGQSYSLAMSSVGRELVTALNGAGSPRPSVDQLAAMGIHGVDAGYVRGLAAIGSQFRRFGGDDLVRMKIHGVKPDYVQAMAAIGPAFGTLTAADLVSFAIHGAKPERVQAFVRSGHVPLRPEDVTAMAIHGVSAGFIDEMAASGFKRFTAEELVKLRIHGVSADYARSLQAHGIKNLDADQLVRLRISGFQPNGS